jgi:hypothetical protein
MSDMDVTLSISLRPEYVDATGTERRVSVDVIGDDIEFQGDRVVITHHGAQVFSGARDDVTGIRITGATSSAPPRFAGRHGQEWSADEDEVLRELIGAGSSMGRLAYEMGRSGVEISKRAGRLGLAHPSR